MKKIEIGFFARRCEYMSELNLEEIHEVMFNWYQHNMSAMVMTEDYCVLCKGRDFNLVDNINKDELNEVLKDWECNEEDINGLILTTPFSYFK